MGSPRFSWNFISFNGFKWISEVLGPEGLPRAVAAFGNVSQPVARPVESDWMPLKKACMQYPRPPGWEACGLEAWRLGGFDWTVMIESRGWWNWLIAIVSSHARRSERSADSSKQFFSSSKRHQTRPSCSKRHKYDPMETGVSSWPEKVAHRVSAARAARV